MGWAALVVLVAVGLAAGFELSRMLMVPPRTDFTGTTLAGVPWSLSSHRGRPVLINFFGTWCAPCRQELPHLMELARRYREQGLEVAILAQEDAPTLRSDPQVGPAPVSFLADATEVFDRYGIRSVPHTILFRRDGQVALELPGYDPGQLGRLERAIRAELGLPETAEAVLR